jgi:hypothetical protein
MTLDELRTELATVTQGKYARVPYEIYAEVFPPGEPDQNARAAAYAFAKSLGFRIENKPDDKSVWFVKEA